MTPPLNFHFNLSMLSPNQKHLKAYKLCEKLSLTPSLRNQNGHKSTQIYILGTSFQKHILPPVGAPLTLPGLGLAYFRKAVAMDRKFFGHIEPAFQANPKCTDEIIQGCNVTVLSYDLDLGLYNTFAMKSQLSSVVASIILDHNLWQTGTSKTSIESNMVLLGCLVQKAEKTVFIHADELKQACLAQTPASRHPGLKTCILKKRPSQKTLLCRNILARTVLITFKNQTLHQHHGI